MTVYDQYFNDYFNFCFPFVKKDKLYSFTYFYNLSTFSNLPELEISCILVL